MKRRRHSEKLPSEYKEVEYLESTGTQYIITNTIPTLTMEFIAPKIKVTDITQTDRWFFGSCDNVYTSCICLGFGGYGFVSIQQRNILKSSVSDLNWHKIVFGNNYLKVDDNMLTGTKNTIAITRTPITLFKLNNYDKAPVLGCIGDELIFMDNSKEINKFIPCVRIADNEAGMYDLVTNTFFTNAGTGSFIVPD